MTDISQYIVSTPDIRSGKPCLKGTRIAVYDVLDYLASGMSEQDIVDDFPSITTQHIRAVLVFASLKERRFLTSNVHKTAA
jgi:uncharacterized protein (DUF433 family)